MWTDAAGGSSSHSPIPQTITFVTPNEQTKRFDPTTKHIAPELIRAVTEEKYNPKLISWIIDTITKSALECALELQKTQTGEANTNRLEIAYRSMKVALKRLEAKETIDPRQRAIIELQQSCEPYEFLNDTNVQEAFNQFFQERVLEAEAFLLIPVNQLIAARDKIRAYIQNNYISPEIFPISGVMGGIFSEMDFASEADIDVIKVIDTMCEHNLFVETAENIADYSKYCRELEIELWLMTNYPVFTYNLSKAEDLAHGIYIWDSWDEWFGGAKAF